MARIQLQSVTRAFSAPAPMRHDWQAAAPGDDGSAEAHVQPGLNRVSLTVADGKTMAMVGPSGCGKSTLLRVVAGLDAAYTGTVTFDARDMRDVAPKERNIGMVFQNYALYPHFEGRGNLSFFFKMRRTPDAEANARIRETAEIMGLGFEQLLPRRPGTLSGGQQQRLAIARALVRKPDLFLFDEPLSNLDAKLRAQTRVEIKRLLRRFAITAIYVTHDQTEAITLGDRIAVMRAGRIEQTGTYHELTRYPANTFVAGFLGLPPMNLLAGRLDDNGCVHCGPAMVRLPQHLLERTAAASRLTLGARPEDGVLISSTAREQASPDDLILSGEVTAIEPDFPRRTQTLHVRCQDVTVTAMVDLGVEAIQRDTVHLRFVGDDLLFFDAQGLRLS